MAAFLHKKHTCYNYFRGESKDASEIYRLAFFVSQTRFAATAATTLSNDRAMAYSRALDLKSVPRGQIFYLPMLLTGFISNGNIEHPSKHQNIVRYDKHKHDISSLQPAH